MRVVLWRAAVQAGALQQHEAEHAAHTGRHRGAHLAVRPAGGADQAHHEGPGGADAVAGQTHGEAGVADEAEVPAVEAGVALEPADLAEGALLEEARLTLAGAAVS